MSIVSYLPSLFSFKKLTYKRVDFGTLWDTKSSFTKFTHILRVARLNNAHIGKYSRVGVNCKLTNVTVGNFSCLGADCVVGVGQHPTNYLTYHSIFYKQGNWGWHDDWIKYPKGFQEQAHITIRKDFISNN